MAKTDEPATSTPAGQFPQEAQGDADRDDRVAPPVISLPKGGGAVRGIGEKFSANPVTGTGSMTIPVTTSPNRAGFELSLELSYDSGAGNGPFGLGWNLSLPRITRKTDKGLPRYVDSAESDVFILSGAEDLVPVLAGDGRRHEDGTSAPGYTIHRYRPRVEGLFARVERWTRHADGDVHWRSFSTDNVLTLYGKDPASRIADPADPRRVFSWLICETRDDKGNAVVYDYKPEDGAGADLSLAHQRHRAGRDDPGRTANRYPKRIRYGNRTPLLDANGSRPHTLTPVEIDSAGWMFEVVIDYGEHDPDTPTPAEVRQWGHRDDAFSSYRSGFEVRTSRLCRRVLMFHHFPDEPDVRNDYLVRSTELTHSHGDWVGSTGTGDPGYTYLVAVTHSGYRRRGDGYLKRSLPAIEFGYAPPTIAQNVSDVAETSVANLPAGVDGATYHWTDLHGEGTPGVLSEQGGAWFYKRNLSPLHADARLAPVELVATRPGLALAEGRAQFMDLAGDGQPDVVVLDGPMPGLYEHDDGEGWQAFRCFSSVLNRDFRDPNLRLMDLNGDGHADVLISEHGAYLWHPSLAEAGFGPARHVTWPPDEEAGPRLVFADGSHSVYLADMSGDGLTDLVRIRNGEVCYWPNLGYGKFGAKVTMDHAPHLDRLDQFDHRRIRLADIDGTGSTDIIYLHRDGVRLYLNQSGNGWSGPYHIAGLPQLDDLTSVTTTDLLGTGTACLVWSSAAPAAGPRRLRYVALTGRHKPHLLTSIANNLGAETRISYAASTKFYLADKATGQPWITRLPFPVHVVERVETYDHISRNRFVSRYGYHHGYFDGDEREFRGFGMVEQRDTEEFAVLAADGFTLVESNSDAASHVPPVLTRTWFHTGAYLSGGSGQELLEPGQYREPGITDDEHQAMTLPDSVLPSGLTAAEEREACRALKGVMLRQEVYASDGSSAAPRPYSVAVRNYTVRALQRRGTNQHAVFLAHDRESLDLHYERAVYEIDGAERPDPRVTHSVVLDVDDFGNVLRSVTIGYGRRFADPDPALTEDDRRRQAETLLTCTESAYTNNVDGAGDWRAPLRSDTRTYELVRARPAAGHSGKITNIFRIDDLRAQATAAGDGSHDLDYLDVFAAAAVDDHPYRRLLDRRRTLYRADDLDRLLPLGALQSHARTGETYTLAFTPGLLDAVLQRAGQPLVSDAAAVLREGGYASGTHLRSAGLFPTDEPDDQWWIPAGRVFYSPEVTHSAAQELAFARQHFFQTHRIEDPFGNATVLAYDPYDLGLTQTRDPLGNTVAAQYDYRVIQPATVTDANGNRSAAAFDALGRVTATALTGRAEDGTGDALDGFEPDPEGGGLAAYLDDPTGRFQDLIGRATTRLIHDDYAYARTRELPQPQPAAVSGLAREQHESDLVGDGHSPAQITFTYFDGFGREIQKKVPAEPGPAVDPAGATPRWVGTGWTVFNNKGKAIRQYEPFFSATHRFEFARVAGVSPTIFYDPLQRVVGTLHSHHCYEKVRFHPWRQEAWDSADTALVPDPATDPDVGDHFRRLDDQAYLPTWHAQRATGELGVAEQRAAAVTAVHAGTPTTTFLDSLGRPFVVVTHNRFERAGVLRDERLATRSVLDIEGQQLALVDGLGRRVVEQLVRVPGAGRTRFGIGYDVAGNMLCQATMDAGVRWTLTNVAGNPIRLWDSRGLTVRTTYDQLQRQSGVFVQQPGAPEMLAVRTVYGEERGPDANHRGRVFQQFDAAGLVTHEAYDFKGNLLRSSRRFAVDYHVRPDWLSEVDLEAEAFTTSTVYDALNRATATTLPDGSTVRSSFNESNLLERLDLQLGGSAAMAVVTNVDYDASGRPTAADYGNGARTEYTYDAVTLLPRQIRTHRNGTEVQDLRYVFDPVANPTSVRDAAQQAVFFRNHRVEPTREYTYDALYQLVRATGREHLGLNGGLPAAPTATGPADVAPLLHPGDGAALGSWEERYHYDGAGNLLELEHHGTDPAHAGWTRTFAYSDPSGIETARAGNRLTRTTTAGAAVDYSYDANGNVTAAPHLHALGWDYRNQIESIDLGGGGTVWYVYDAAGERVRKVVDRQNGTRQEDRRYLPAFEVFRRFTGSGSLSLERTTVHLLDEQRRVALVEMRTQGDDGSPARLMRYQVTDQIGSTSVELDEAGQVVSFEEYYPYGGTAYHAARAGLEASPKRYRFASREREEESGLYHMGARYYAPWLARWISADPNGFGDGPNLYRYAHGNPVLLRDTEGTDPRADRVILALAQFRQQEPERFLAFLVQNEPLIYPFLRPYGYQGCWVDESRALRDFDEATVRWAMRTGNRLPMQVIRIVEPDPNQVILAALPDGTGYVGTRQSYQRAYDRQVFQRWLRTGDNIRGGIFGTIGYALGGDEGSDLGAAADGLAMAAAGTARHRAYNQALSGTGSGSSRTTATRSTASGSRRQSSAAAPPTPPGNQSRLRTEGLSRTEAAELLRVRTETFNLPAAPTAANTRIVGVLITPSGERIPIHSGQFGGPSGGTHRGGIPRGPGSGFTRHTLTHVEGHAAAIMHQRGIQQATLLIERAPCQACDNPTQTPNVSAMLPRGARLTVVDPHSATTFSSSQR